MIKLLSGTDIDEIDTYPSIQEEFEKFEKELELSLVYENIQKNENTKIVRFEEKYPKFYNYIQQVVREKKKEIEELIKVKGENKILRKILNDISVSPTIYGFNDYIDLIFRFILDNSIDEQIIFEILEYLLLNYTPKNFFDIPYVKWNENEIIKSPGKGIKPLAFLYNDLRKWDKKRIELAKNTNREKQILVVNDFNWIWLNLKKLTLENLSYNDVILKEFMNNLLYKITWILLSTHIIYNYYNEEQLLRLKKILNYLEFILSENNEKFYFNKLYDYILEEQLINQYILVENIKEKKITGEFVKKIINDLSNELLELIQKYESDKKKYKSLKDIIRKTEQKIKDLKNYEKSGTTFTTILPILVSRFTKNTQISDLDTINFLITNNLVKRFKLIG